MKGRANPNVPTNHYVNNGGAATIHTVRGNVIIETTTNNHCKNPDCAASEKVPIVTGKNEKTETIKTKNTRTKELEIRIKAHVSIFNQSFQGTRMFRSGSDKDVESLLCTFRRYGVEPTALCDLKYKDIIGEVAKLSTMNFSGCKFFVCVFMSHGQENGIVFASDRNFHLKKCIIHPIMRNRTLNGIRKIFITVACRGSHRFDSNYYHQEAVDHGRDDITDEQYKEFDFGNYSQSIISYSTYDGHVSKRTPSGTYFIQQFCSIMDKEYGSNAKIHSIFAKVNGELQQRFNQIPVFESTMDDICLKDLVCDLDDDIGRTKSHTNDDTDDVETGERPFDSACSKNRNIYRVKFASEFMCICVESHDSIPTIEEFINAVKFTFKIDDKTDFAIKDHLGCVISGAITFEEYMLNIFDSQQTILEIDCELRGNRPVENPSPYTDHMQVPIYENGDAFDVNVLAKDLINYFKHQTHISCIPSGAKLIDRYHIGENPIMEVGHAKLIARISANHLMFLKHSDPSVEDRILWAKVICTVFPQLTAEYYSVMYDPRRGDGFLEEQIKLSMKSKP